ncbi:MAG: chemotaxis protein CheC [Oscillospiraceae bacterium]
MALKSYNDLSDMHRDMLQELGNIGCGNAVTSLATMTSKKIDMSVPKVHILNYDQIANLLGGPENTIVAMMVDFEGDVNGTMMFLLSHDFAGKLIEDVSGISVKDFNRLGEIECSVLMELSNIMGGAYISALSTLTNLSIALSVPYLSSDMVGAVLNAPAVKYEKLGDQVIFIEENIETISTQLTSNILVIFDLESLDKIMGALGLEI